MFIVMELSWSHSEVRRKERRSNLALTWEHEPYTRSVGLLTNLHLWSHMALYVGQSEDR